MLFLQLCRNHFFEDFISFLERGDRREKERERNIGWLPLIHTN